MINLINYVMRKIKKYEKKNMMREMKEKVNIYL